MATKVTPLQNELAVKHKWGKTHEIRKIMTVEPNLQQLASNQSVVWGDGETYCWLLTEKAINHE